MEQQLWLFLSEKNRPGAALTAAALSWIAAESGALLDCYLETERDGRLFAENGSTIISGRHFQDFNYLCCRADVKIIRFGDTRVFDSSIREFGLETIASGSTNAELYRTLFRHLDRPERAGATVLVSAEPLTLPDGGEVKILPYLFPEVAYRKALFFPTEEAESALPFLSPGTEVLTAYRGEAELEALRTLFPRIRQVDTLQNGDSWRTLTLRIAERWKHRAKSLFFGDPAALACRIPAECREQSVAVFAPPEPMSVREIQVAGYVEKHSAAAVDAAELAQEIGNSVIHGRQTLDGDILLWSRYGVCIQIVDPNRPAFPVISEFPHVWSSPPPGETEEISDEQLREWARQGKLLTTLLWHSGEIAHNEAMLNVLECAALNHVRMGIGVHAQRYETCPQHWELIRTPEAAGGAAEYIEPVLHSGGLGVMAETFCPPERFAENIRTALARIEAVTGPAGRPRGYYAFLDSDLATHLSGSPAIWRAAAEAGMEYFISSACPGRNRILAQPGGCVVLNQSCRVLESSSPFVRITTAEDVRQRRSPVFPGWMIATLDAPVIAFQPYIWEKGHRFMELLNAVRTGERQVNVKPSVIARYARILHEDGFLPPVGLTAFPGRDSAITPTREA